MNHFQFPQGHPMARVTYTPDSLAVVTAQPHTGVVVRDRFTGRTLHEVPVRGAATFEALCVSPCGRFMAVVGEHHVQVHDLATAGEPLLFRSVVWTAVIVGQILRCATPRSQLFDLSLPPPQSLGTEPFIESHRLRWFGRVLAMSPDGGLAVSVSHRDANPVLMDLRTREPVARLDFALMWDEPLHAVAVFSPDSTTLALGNGDGVAVFDLRGTLRAGPGEDVPRLLPRYVLERPDRVAGDAPAGGQPGHWSPPFAFTPDGNQFLTLGLRERVQLYDARTGLVAAQWGWRMEDVVSLAVAPDGLTACAGGRRGRLTVWDLC